MIRNFLVQSLTIIDQIVRRYDISKRKNTTQRI